MFKLLIQCLDLIYKNDLPKKNQLQFFSRANYEVDKYLENIPNQKFVDHINKKKWRNISK